MKDLKTKINYLQLKIMNWRIRDIRKLSLSIKFRKQLKRKFMKELPKQQDWRNIWEILQTTNIDKDEVKKYTFLIFEIRISKQWNKGE